VKAVSKTKAGPGIEILEKDVPVPAEGEILVRVRACGLCGTDLSIFEWKEARPGYRWLDSSVRIPVVLGHEFAGEVVEVGPMVQGIGVGDRVSASPVAPCGECPMCLSGKRSSCPNSTLGMHLDGAMAGYVRVKDVADIYRLDDRVTYEVGALLEPLSVAVHAVELSRIRPGDPAVIFGPGPIGLLLLLVLRASGAGFVGVMGTAGDRERMRLAGELGADLVVDVGDEHALEMIGEGTEGAWPKVAYEASGNPMAIPRALRMLRVGGRLVLLGMYGSPAEFNPLDLVMGGKSVIGAVAYEAASWRRAHELVSNGAIRPERIITHRLPLEEARKGFELAAKREAVKVMFIP